MRVRTVLAVAAISLIAATGCQRHKKSAFQGPPPVYPGSYAQSCRNITTLDGGYISAECANQKGVFNLTYLQAAACKGDIGNNNGVLNCSGAVATTTKPVLLPPAAVAAASDAAAAASDAPAQPAPAQPAPAQPGPGKAAPDGLKP